MFENLHNLLRKAGIDVVTDNEEGQRVLDMANGRGVTLNKAQKRILETAPLIQEEGSRADISSIDGAKVLKNLDILAEKLEKSSSDRKNFLQEVGNALNAKQHGSKSQYATFETKNGQIVTIRLGNHNATVSSFDNNGEDNGISIVISRRANQGITNDGNAHLVEYFYSDKAINRAEGKPLADIVRSIKQALYSGEYKDTTGLAEREEVNAEQVRMHRVYHGSGADFEAFDHTHMGEGEGNQSFGWGTYVTEVEGIGKKYANDAVGKYSPYQKVEYVGEKTDTESMSHAKAIAPLFNGGSRDWNGVLEFLEQTKESPRTQRHIEWFKKTRPEDWKSANDGKRTLYTVEIPDDNGSNFLEWDKKASDKQTEAIKNALMQNEAFRTNLKNEYDSRNEWTDKPPFEEWLENVASVTSMYGKENGKRLYNELSNMMGSEQAASEFLHSAGFVGIKYPADYYNGGRADGAKNYVIFNESDLQITDKVKFFRTESGEVYGFTMGGKIYLDPKIATAETPIHEYTHLWAAVLRQANPKAWEQLKSELAKDTELMAYVRRLYPELDNGQDARTPSDELMDEVFAHFSGRRGAERLRAEQERMEGETQSIVGKAKVIAMFENLRNALRRFWNAARELFAGKSVKNESAEDFADMVLADLLGGVNPNNEIEAVKDEVFRQFTIAKNTDAKGRSIQIGNLTQEGRKLLETISGMKMKHDISFNLNISDLRHIYNEHYGDNEKDKGNNIPLTDEDIRSIVDVLYNPDDVIFGVEKKGEKRKLFFFLKDAGDGAYNLTEVYADRRGNLTAKSYYKTKKGSNLRAVSIKNDSELSTSKTSGASLFSGAKIPTLFEISEKIEKKDEIKYQRADILNDYQERITAGQELKDEVNASGHRASFNADYTINLVHGTSPKAAEKIKSEGLQKGSYLAPSRNDANTHVSAKRKDNTFLTIRVDARDISYNGATNEYYAEDGLVMDEDGVWVSPQRKAARQADSDVRFRGEEEPVFYSMIVEDYYNTFILYERKERYNKNNTTRQ